MPLVRVTNNSVELIDDKTFQVIRTIATSVSSADRNAKTGTSVIVHTDGRVILYDDTARVVRSITTGGVSSIFSGDDIVVRKKEGRTEVWTVNGQLLRTMDSINLKKIIKDFGL